MASSARAAFSSANQTGGNGPNRAVPGMSGLGTFTANAYAIINGTWVSVLTNTPVSSPFILTDTNASAGPKVYRIVVGPPVP